VRPELIALLALADEKLRSLRAENNMDGIRMSTALTYLQSTA
jgi:hypothetical protein